MGVFFAMVLQVCCEIVILWSVWEKDIAILSSKPSEETNTCLKLLKKFKVNLTCTSQAMYLSFKISSRLYNCLISSKVNPIK